MKKWPWKKILLGAVLFLIAVGIFPFSYLYWFAHAHNLQPLSMPVPLQQGEYASAEFKTDLDENYMIQLELMDPTRRSIELNKAAVLDLDWKIVDAKGDVIQRGSQDLQIGAANEVNLGEYHPQRGVAQRLILDLHRNLDEPEGSRVTIDVNSTEDPEGMAFGFVLFARWAIFVAGPGVIILVALLVARFVHPSGRDRPAKTPQTP